MLETFIKYAVTAVVLVGGALFAIWRARVDGSNDAKQKAAISAAAAQTDATAASDALRAAAQAARDRAGNPGTDGVREPGTILEPGDFRD